MVTASNVAAAFPHPLDGLPVKRVFTAQAAALLPAAVLADPAHPWLLRQEAALPRGVLSVVYCRDAVELVTPRGVLRRPFVGFGDLPRDEQPQLAARAPARSAQQIAAAERTRAWKAANRDKVRAQHKRQAERRKAERDQLREAVAATNRAA